MKQFIHDMIHMTEGEKFVKYWWLWLIIMIVAALYFSYKVFIDDGRSDYK